jgi:hypothetical protein
MRNLWEYHEIQSEIRTRFLAELRRELDALLVGGPLESSRQIARSPAVNLLLVSWYPNAIRGRAVRIAREIDAKYQTDTKLFALTPDRLLAPHWNEDAPVMVLLHTGVPLYGESAAIDYRAELRQARQPA